MSVVQDYLNSSTDSTPRGLCGGASVMTIAAGAEVIEGGVEDLCTGTFIVAFSQTDDPRSRHAYVTVADEGACVQSSTAW